MTKKYTHNTRNTHWAKAKKTAQIFIHTLFKPYSWHIVIFSLSFSFSHSVSRVYLAWNDKRIKSEMSSRKETATTTIMNVKFRENKRRGEQIQRNSIKAKVEAHNLVSFIVLKNGFSIGIKLWHAQTHIHTSKSYICRVSFNTHKGTYTNTN